VTNGRLAKMSRARGTTLGSTGRSVGGIGHGRSGLGGRVANINCGSGCRIQQARISPIAIADGRQAAHPAARSYV
jgi:hypothetical protein